MSELVTRAPAAESPGDSRGGGGKKTTRRRKALELVAMRGKDVIGVRHLLEGGCAWIGNVAETLARVPMGDFGGQPLVVGEVSDGAFTVHVAPRARARFHGADGLARILVGPQRISLREGERAVVVLGAVQIRAQIATVDGGPGKVGMPGGTIGWVAFVAAVYVAALSLCVVLSPPEAQKLPSGGVQRSVMPYLPRR